MWPGDNGRGLGMSHIWVEVARGPGWAAERCKICNARRESRMSGGGRSSIIYHPDGVQHWAEKLVPPCSAIKMDEALA